MGRFGQMIYDGRSISASGIQYAMEWYGIKSDDYANTANKIVLYYSIVRHTQQEKQQKELDKHGSKANKNRSSSRRPKRH